jgi:hypothetical protein
MRSLSGRPTSIWSVLAVSLLGLGALAMLGAAPAAHAVTEPAYCSTLGGTWLGSTCTFSSEFILSSGTLEVTTGTTLLLDCSSCVGNLIFGSTGSLLVDSGATVNVQSTGACAYACFGIDLDGSGTSITNHGAINVDTSLNCTGPGECLGINNLGGTITNYGTINIESSGGTCSGGSYCFGVNNAGTLTDVDCGTTSPLTSPYFVGNSVNTSGTCTKTGVPQFPLGIALLFALMVPALLVLRKRASALGLAR